jgi:hypothetical protein
MPASSAFLPRRIPQKTKRRVLSTVDGSNHIRVRYLRTGPRVKQHRERNRKQPRRHDDLVPGSPPADHPHYIALMLYAGVRSSRRNRSDSRTDHGW